MKHVVIGIYGDNLIRWYFYSGLYVETVPAVDVITFIFHSMDESYRPVTLRKTVLGYNPCYNNGSEFKFDISLNYKLANVIQTYSENKPSLVVSGSVDASVVSIQRMWAAISFE